MSRHPNAAMTRGVASPGTTRLHIRVEARTTPAAAHSTLGPDRSAWLGLRDQPGLPPPAPGRERYLLDLEMPLGEAGQRFTLHKAALVDIGPLHQQVNNGPMCVLIDWRAASLAPLFPVFSGSLCWADGELSLDGCYAPPGGRIGQAADRVLQRIVAQRTARWLLGRVAAVMSAQAAPAAPAAPAAQAAQSRSSR